MKDPSVLVEITQENNEWDLLSTKRSIGKGLLYECYYHRTDFWHLS